MSSHPASTLSLEETFRSLSLYQPPTSQPTLLWTTDDHGISTLSAFDEGILSPATLTVLGAIEPSQRHVAAVHASYKGPTSIVPALTDARLCITLGAQYLNKAESQGFKRSLSFLDQIMRDCSKASYRFKSVGVRKETRIEMEHRLFQKVENGDFPFMDRDFTDRFKRNATAGWPVLPEAEAELREVVRSRSHKVTPLPVLKHGIMIPPDLWSTELRPGTVVEVDFAITLRVSEKEYRNIFNAAMSTIRVVRARSSP